jgi:metal-responsive CopG/Arc/MetJ family transcriptional regulator
MAVLTVNVPVLEEKVREVDDLAKREDRTRGEIVDEAIDKYLFEKFMVECHAHGRSLGITPDVVAEEIRLYREEKKTE